jgi:hypothetical protein
MNKFIKPIPLNYNTFEAALTVEPEIGFGLVQIFIAHPPPQI